LHCVSASNPAQLVPDGRQLRQVPVGLAYLFLNLALVSIHSKKRSSNRICCTSGIVVPWAHFRCECLNPWDPLPLPPPIYLIATLRVPVVNFRTDIAVFLMAWVWMVEGMTLPAKFCLELEEYLPASDCLKAFKSIDGIPTAIETIKSPAKLFHTRLPCFNVGCPSRVPSLLCRLFRESYTVM